MNFARVLTFLKADVSQQTSALLTCFSCIQATAIILLYHVHMCICTQASTVCTLVYFILAVMPFSLWPMIVLLFCDALSQAFISTVSKVKVCRKYVTFSCTSRTSTTHTFNIFTSIQAAYPYLSHMPNRICMLTYIGPAC